jgi:hypothetical protein
MKEVTTVDRRRFVVTAGGALAAAGAAAVVDAPTSLRSPKSNGGCPRPGPRRSTCCRARRFQAQHTGWSHVSEGAYQQFVAL